MDWVLYCNGQLRNEELGLEQQQLFETFDEIAEDLLEVYLDKISAQVACVLRMERVGWVLLLLIEDVVKWCY